METVADIVKDLRECPRGGILETIIAVCVKLFADKIEAAYKAEMNEKEKEIEAKDKEITRLRALIKPDWSP